MSRCSENAEKTCKSYPNCDGCNAYGNSKNLTDEHILKALEFCYNRKNTVVLVRYNDDDTKSEITVDDIFEVINTLQRKIKAFEQGNVQLRDTIDKQNAEIENQSQNFKVLVSDHRTLQQSFDNLKDLYEDEKAKVEKAKGKCIGFAKELQTAKAEIEKLQTDNSSMQSTLAKMSMGVEQARTYAIKEFAKRVKADVYDWIDDFGVNPRYSIATARIDYLVKEMVGDTE